MMDSAHQEDVGRFQSDTGSRQQLVTLFLALVVMSLGAALYNRQQINAEDFALGKDNSHRAEAYQGIVYTASSVPDIKSVVDLAVPKCSSGREKKVIWLGNSQLHTINQYQNGQHLAPYWVRETARQRDCFWPYGLSLPNANFQEYFALTAYSLTAMRVDAAVLSLVFDDLREDGLRPGFSVLMADGMRKMLEADEVGRDIVARYDKDQAQSRGNAEENQGLNGFVQKRFEDSLTDGLGKIIPGWADRPNLRAHLLTDLYYLRNYVLHIQATTARKQIPARYARNMAALEASLRHLRDQRIPIVLYIAPIRQDATLPYDLAEYTLWKSVVTELAFRYGAQFMNLETEVPAGLWGSYHKADLDFMHFQGEGHRLLATAVEKSLRKVLGEY